MEGAERSELRRHLEERHPRTRVELCELWHGPNGITERVLFVCDDDHAAGALVPQEVVLLYLSGRAGLVPDEFGSLWSIDVSGDGRTHVCRHVYLDDRISDEKLTKKALNAVERVIKRLSRQS